MSNPHHRSFVYTTLFFILGVLILSPLQVMGAASFQITVATSASPTAGSPVTLTTSVTNGGTAASNTLVDIEVFDSSQQRVYQKFFENQNLGATAQNYTVSWIPKSSGNYTAKVGVFAAGWSNLHYWTDQAATIIVANQTATTLVVNTNPLEIWWPSASAALSGTQPFKGMVSGLPLSAYKLYWQVDGGQLNPMADTNTDYPHKESLVDVSGWNWRGQGPYNLTFVAKNLSGATIALKQVSININSTDNSTNYVTNQNPSAPVAPLPTVSSPDQSSTSAPTAGQITVSVNSSQNRHAISPYIYGTNFQENPNSWDGAQHNLGLARFGGNRLTTYNWENNASNAGNDWQQQNDGYLGGGDTPGEAVRSRVALAHNNNAAALVTVPMQGYVAADKNGDGDVANTANYLTTRFRKTVAHKDGPLSASPNLGDGAVYQDEFVSWLEKQFPDKTNPMRKIFYSLDNEPDLWSSSHPRIESKPVTYAELMNKSVAFADAIKDVAPQSLVFGAANYGYNGFQTLQNATDANGRNFLDFYLESMKEAEKNTGHRVLDVMDVHWYPEAQGGGRRITADDSDPAIAEARMQAPRSLWDPNYVESSWITQGTGAIALLPTLKNRINAHYPGTKLAVTEYYYGGGADISGAIAQADVLGIFGRENVFAANLWHVGATDDRFIYGAFDMFRNIDGKKTSFGDTSIAATTNNVAASSVYASVDSQNPNRLTIIAINKTNQNLPLNLSLTHPTKLNQAAVYQLTSGSATPVAKGTLSVANNTLTSTLPGHSITTFIVTP